MYNNSRDNESLLVDSEDNVQTLFPPTKYNTIFPTAVRKIIEHNIHKLSVFSDINTFLYTAEILRGSKKTGNETVHILDFRDVTWNNKYCIRPVLTREFTVAEQNHCYGRQKLVGLHSGQLL